MIDFELITCYYISYPKIRPLWFFGYLFTQAAYLLDIFRNQPLRVVSIVDYLAKTRRPCAADRNINREQKLSTLN